MSKPYPDASPYPTAPAAWDPENKSSVNITPPPYQEPSAGGFGGGYQTGYPTVPPQNSYTPEPGQYGMNPMGHPAAVTVQPGVYITQVQLAHPEPEYLGYSIFTMLCCCLPIGIAALIYSISTRDANNIGNLDLARKHSRTARVLNHTALGIGICILVIWIGAVIAINFIH
ncbi:interferon-induced transmembrane protein 1-like isoform X2 [Polypterus senegalus]|uniref:interferon-induced transmembrane protein 1-like isoform X2 n=1 Tax=Polypterus senegalus TaxID=55291 RepID=UPI0019641B91|nr:interferon-induced transmembrane protein 1-like isoform X2 [Polypterus senegalus]